PRSPFPQSVEEVRRAADLRCEGIRCLLTTTVHGDLRAPVAEQARNRAPHLTGAHQEHLAPDELAEDLTSQVDGHRRNGDLTRADRGLAANALGGADRPREGPVQ